MVIPVLARLSSMLILASQSKSVSALHFSSSYLRFSRQIPATGTGEVRANNEVVSLHFHYRT